MGEQGASGKSKREPFSVRRSDETRPVARFYIKGSWVLDRVFSTNFAQDVDIFYDNSGRFPTIAEIAAWLTSKGFPTTHPVDATPVRASTFDDCDGGGFPVLSFERWHFRDDGNLYTLIDTTEPRDGGGLFGNPLFLTRVCPLAIANALVEPVTLVGEIDDISIDSAGLKHVSKLLQKLGRHSMSRGATLVAALEERRDQIRDALFESEGSDDDEG